MSFLKQASHLFSRLRRAALASATIAALSAPSSALAKVTGLDHLFVFGDSLSDNGNSGLLTGFQFPPSPPYVQNRFSNGKVAVEYLWEALNPGDTTFRPSLSPLGGTNYAIGGATTGKENNISVSGYPFPIPILFADKGNAWQLDAFQAGSPSFNADRSLFVVWLFPNDLFYFNNTPTNDSVGTYDGIDGSPTTAPEIPGLAVSNLVGSIQWLASMGARNFLVMNSPDLSQTPALLNNPGAKAISQAFNQNLELELNNLRTAQPDLDVDLYRVDQTLNAIIENPSLYGFTNVSQACVIGGTVCANPSQYLFWDALHPTTAAHAILAQGMVNFVPGPLPVVGGVMTFGWARRLRRRVASAR